MRPIDDAFIELEKLNTDLLEKKSRGERVSKEENERLKAKMKAVHLLSADVSIEDLAGLLEKHDILLAMAHIEPSYDRINSAFAWLEERDGERDDDF